MNILKWIYTTLLGNSIRNAVVIITTMVFFGSGIVIGNNTIGTKIVGIVVSWIFGWLFVGMIQHKFGKKENESVRGTKLLPQVKGKTINDNVLSIGGIEFPDSITNLHTLVVGGIGTGKSQVLNSFMKTLRDRGDKVLVCDSGGEAYCRLFREGDTMLSVHDARTARWSVFSEISGPGDAARMAASMIPAAESGPSREWELYSQNLVGAVLSKMWQDTENPATNQRLIHLLLVADAKEMGALLKGTTVQILFQPGNEKMLGNVRSIVSSFLSAYQYLPWDGGKNSFSVRKWVAEENSSWLWLPYLDSQLEGVKSLLSCWIGEAVNATLSLRPDESRHIWVFLDEASSLGRVNGLVLALAKGRKFGLRVCLGMQSLSQLRESYGRDGAQTLLSCLLNVVCLRGADSESSKYFSDYFGRIEFTRTEETKNADGGKSSSVKHHTESAILESEISGLRKLTGFLRLADAPEVVHKINIPICDLGDEIIVPFKAQEQ